MITEDAIRQNVYQHILKAANRRLSLVAVLNLLFLIRGEWGSIGDFVTTQRALRAIVGDDLLWAEPQKPSPAPDELIQ